MYCLCFVDFRFCVGVGFGVFCGWCCCFVGWVFWFGGLGFGFEWIWLL